MMGDAKQVDIFNAMQRLSLFMLKGGTLDEPTKILVRSVFNENATKTLERQDAKLESQRYELQELTRELIEVYQLYCQAIERLATVNSMHE